MELFSLLWLLVSVLFRAKSPNKTTVQYLPSTEWQTNDISNLIVNKVEYLAAKELQSNCGNLLWSVLIRRENDLTAYFLQCSLYQLLHFHEITTLIYSYSTSLCTVGTIPILCKFTVNKAHTNWVLVNLKPLCTFYWVPWKVTLKPLIGGKKKKTSLSGERSIPLLI